LLGTIACGNAAPGDSGMPDTAADSATSAPGAPGDTLAADDSRADTARAAAPIITSDGIGLARRGTTLGALRAALPTSHVIGDSDDAFMVDIVAVPIVAGGDTLYRLIFPAGEAIGDDALPHFVMTMHAGVRTEDGVGPGSTLGDAAQIYGAPTLSYSIHDESREYAAFPGQPENVRFRVQPVGDAMFAGEYATDDEYNTTGVHDSD